MVLPHRRGAEGSFVLRGGGQYEVSHNSTQGPRPRKVGSGYEHDVAIDFEWYQYWCMKFAFLANELSKHHTVLFAIRGWHPNVGRMSCACIVCVDLFLSFVEWPRLIKKVSIATDWNRDELQHALPLACHWRVTHKATTHSSL